MIEIIQKTAKNELATVYIARTRDGKMFEFVESTQPPYSIQEKWVLIISTLFGCPSSCTFCDAGGQYKGKLSYDQLLYQIDYLVESRFNDSIIDTDKFKIQFARMGDPAFNDAVLEVLEDIPARYRYRNFIPSISTIAPHGSDHFFERLLQIKNRLYKNTFQLQFSIHSTNPYQRDKLMPIKKWSFEKIAEYGKRFYHQDEKKITLNFALTEESEIDPTVLKQYFDPSTYIIKITPLNPTFKALENNLSSMIIQEPKSYPKIDAVRDAGYHVILSIGEWEENQIGSNCGQYISTYLKSCEKVLDSYSLGTDIL